MVLIAVLMATNARVVQAQYRYEDDPIRLGNKALAESRLQDADRYFNEAIASNYQIYKARCGLAYILMRQGDAPKAEPIFRQALEETKKETGADNFPELHAGLGLVLVRLGRPEEAKQHFEIALKQRESYWPAEYGLARLAIIEKRYDEARTLINRGKDKSGLEKGEDYYLYGLALLQRADGQLEEAEKNALKASVIDPAQPEYIKLVAEIYEDRGSPQLAIGAYKRAIAAPGALPSAPMYHSLGVQYQMERQFNEALDQYKKSVEIDSTFTPAWKDMATLYALAKQNDRAAIAWQKYTNLQPGDIEGYVGLAKACLRTNRVQPAKQAAVKAWDMDSTRVDIRLLVARSSFLTQDRTRAERLYWSIQDSTLFEAQDRICLGQMEQKEQDYETAERHFRKAAELDSTLPDAPFNLGVLFLTQKMLDSAEVNLKKAIEIQPKSSGAWLNLGVVYMQQKRNGDAVETLREASRLAPSFAQTWVYFGHALMAADSTTAAARVYEKALEISPADPQALRGVGYARLKKQDFEGAVAVLRKATEADPKSVDGWTMLGQAELGRANYTEASKAFRRALDLKPTHELAKQGLDQAERSFREGMEIKR
jgi:tetratricopeptide (TPR) repeat protein